jgi:hypothetical protein
MGEPVIIWPPNCGNYDDGNGQYICPSYGDSDCTDYFDSFLGFAADSGLVCCAYF